MTGPQTVNKAATIGDEVISSAATAGAQAITALIIADVPFFGLPVIKNLLNYIVGYVCIYVSKAVQTGVTFAVIDIQVGAEQNKLSIALAALIEADKTGDSIAIQQAIKNYAAAQSALINFDGSAAPQ